MPTSSSPFVRPPLRSRIYLELKSAISRILPVPTVNFFLGEMLLFSGMSLHFSVVNCSLHRFGAALFPGSEGKCYACRAINLLGRWRTHGNLFGLASLKRERACGFRILGPVAFPDLRFHTFLSDDGKLSIYFSRSLSQHGVYEGAFI